MKTDLRIEQLSVDELLPDPHNPRTGEDEKADADLAASIAAHDVKVPLICFQTPEGIMIADGHRRWRGAKAVERKQVPGIVLAKRPDEGELLTTQLVINAHRSGLNLGDEYDAFQRLAKLRNWTPAKLAEGLNIPSAEVTRVLSFGKLTAKEQQLVRQQRICKSSAYALARMDVEERADVAERVAAGELTRDQLETIGRKRAKGDKLTSRRICCHVAKGVVTVNTRDGLSLSTLIELLDGLARTCRRLRSQKLDIRTAIRVLKDQAAASEGATASIAEGT